MGSEHIFPKLFFNRQNNLQAVFLLFWCFSGVYSDHNNVVVPSARIAIVNLNTSKILRTITYKTNHEVVLTMPAGHREAYLFECNATYPVEWNYFGEGAPSTNADVGRQFKDFYDVTTYTYQAVLVIPELDELQSGRYVCRGSHVEYEKLQVHYDAFVPGNGTQMLISTAERKVFVSETKLLVSLPCEVTDPSLTLNLYKGNDWGAFHRVDTNDSIIFRPRKGFILKMHELPDPYGTYMCITPDNKRRRKIHLIPEHLRDRYDDNHLKANKVTVHMSYDYEHNRMLCCSGGNALAPKLQWASCGSVQDCKIKSVCFEEERCGNDVLQRWMDPGPLPRGCAGWKLRKDPEGDFGIIKCSTPAVTQYQPYLMNRGNIFVDFDTAPPSESILTLTKSSSDPIYLGSEVEYHCNSTRFYFAVGIRWAFKRANDEIEFIEDTSRYIVKDEFPIMSHMRSTKFRILQPDIKAIICFVPIANSPTEWRTVSLPITIRDAFHLYGHSHEELPVKRPSMMDYPGSHSSASHVHSVAVEPYSTSRPYLLPNVPNSREPIDSHPPGVDIDEIIGTNAQRRVLHSRPQSQNIRYHPTPSPISFHHQSENQGTTPQGIEMAPEIITMDNIKPHHNSEKFDFPSQSELVDANNRHRMKHKMHHENIVPYTTTLRPLPIPVASPPFHSKFSAGQDSYIREKLATATAPPTTLSPARLSNYKDLISYSDEKPKRNHQEFKVSSKMEIGVPSVSRESGQSRYSNPLVMHNSPPSSTSNQREELHRHKGDPPKYLQSQRANIDRLPSRLTTKESEEPASSASISQPQYRDHQPQRHPVIVYDSREKQYGLRESSQVLGSSPVVNPHWRKYQKSEEKVEDSSTNERIHDHYPTPTPHRRQHHLPLQQPQDPPMLDIYDAEDYYLSSLRTKQQQKQSNNKVSKQKSYVHKEKLKPQPQVPVVGLPPHHSPKYSVPDYEIERDKYYYQRYAATGGGGGGGQQDILGPSPTSYDWYADPSTQPYFQADNNLKRNGYHVSDLGVTK